ncbi:MAG: hypothetical protein U0556_18725 [Dehalococcoidia bacterium]
MQTLALLVDQRAVERVEQIRRTLQDRLALPAADGLPGCALVVASQLDGGVDDALRATCAGWRPVTLQVQGLRIAGGSHPTLSLAIARGAALAEIQRTLYLAIDDFATAIDPSYAPDRWMPEIPLLSAEPEQIGRAAGLLSGTSFDWRIAANRLVRTGGPEELRIGFGGAWGE